MSWIRTDTDGRYGWEQSLAALQVAGVALPPGLAVTDLRWWQDRVLGPDGDEMPSAGEFARRWGWSKTRAYNLLVQHELWSDPLRLEAWKAHLNDAGTTAERQRNDSGTSEDGSSDTSDEERNDSGTTAERQRNATGHTRVDLARVENPPPSPSQKTQQKTQLPLDGAPDPAPEWARKADRRGTSAIDLSRHVVRALEAIRGATVNPARCGTDAREVLGLWKAQGRPPIGELADEIVLVATWAQQSIDPLAARDIRAEGWTEGKDRSRTVSTLCRREKWGDRLAAARAWRGAEPVNGVAHEPDPPPPPPVAEEFDWRNHRPPTAPIPPPRPGSRWRPPEGS